MEYSDRRSRLDSEYLVFDSPLNLMGFINNEKIYITIIYSIVVRRYWNFGKKNILEYWNWNIEILEY